VPRILNDVLNGSSTVEQGAEEMQTEVEALQSSLE